MKTAFLFLICTGVFGQVVKVPRLKCGIAPTSIPVSINFQTACFVLDATLVALPPTATAPGVLKVNVPLVRPVFYGGPTLPGQCGAQGLPGAYPLYTLFIVYGTGRVTIPGTADSVYVSLNGEQGTCTWVPLSPVPPDAPTIWDWYGPPPAPTCGRGGAMAGFGVGLGMRVYVQAVAGVSGDAWYICGQNAAQAISAAGELVPLAVAP
jgi:hypothetical protein